MKLPIIEQTIETCKKHLTDNNAKGTEIEAFLTRYLLIFICANFEEEIKKIVVERAKKTNDKFIISFVESSVKQIFRSIKTSEIKGLLNRFGNKYKNNFEKKVTGTKEESFYNNIVINRHLTAHSGGANLTFDELVSHYEKAHIILDYVREALA
jgi:hypothetical protein